MKRSHDMISPEKPDLRCCYIHDGICNKVAVGGVLNKRYCNQHYLLLKPNTCNWAIVSPNIKCRFMTYIGICGKDSFGGSPGIINLCRDHLHLLTLNTRIPSKNQDQNQPISDITAEKPTEKATAIIADTTESDKILDKSRPMSNNSLIEKKPNTNA
jgi:hypothetical protein